MESASVEEGYVKFATFMAGVSAYALEAKNRYDPLRVFLSSKIDPLPYQVFDFSKLIEELRTQGNIRALIAYETGLGKTILAGMLMQELVASLSQHRNARVLVLTPPGVVLQFHDELLVKFGIELTIFDSAIGKFSDQMIASIDTMKFDTWKKKLADNEWDLVLVDELHRASPDNLRGELLELVQTTTKNLVALTATPHDGKSERYYYRLSLIAPNPFVIRRTKRESLDINNNPLFGQDVIETTEDFPVTALELEFYEAAESYAKDRFKSEGAGALVAVVMGRAISSSIRAGVKMLARRRARLLNPGPDANPEVVKDMVEHLKEGGELSDNEIDVLFNMERISPEEKDRELALLEPVLQVGKEILALQRPDSKGQYLLDHLEEWIAEDRKVLIFTSFLETVEYLSEILEKKGHACKKITSRISFEDRKQTVRQLDEEESVRIIVGTDAMSESLNLQAASVEINYEVPWSPVTYIQRVGRIWRLKQKHDPLYIHNFLPAFKVEQRVQDVILEKIKIINAEFGEVGLSIFASQLGDIEEILHQESESEVSQRVETAYQACQRISQQVVDVLNRSITLPRIVNVEELQRSAYINLEETFTEADLNRFLHYLKDTGYASGQLPHGPDEASTYTVSKEGRYIAVETLSIRDLGVRTSIEVAKDLIERSSDVRFAYHKHMRGELAVYSISVDGTVVYEEPVLVTPDGVLTYDGIMSLRPYFAEKQTSVTFIPYEEYAARREQEWMSRSLYLWEERENDIRKEIIFSSNQALQERNRTLLQEHLSKRPSEVRIEKGRVICDVEFEQTESEESWLERYEVEKLAMDAARTHFKGLGYSVDDVASQNRGYDLLCRKTSDILRVEVKGIRGASHPTMTENERRNALDYEESFVLFILEIKDLGDRTYAIANPTTRITLTPHQKTEYSVSGYAKFEIDG